MKVCLDSRLVKSGEYFVPVKGENFDGHKFIDVALKNGAAGIIEQDDLYKLASEKLSKINPTVIAITGSVGKSTMRKFVSDLLKQKFRICEGDLNTKLGLAVNIMNDMQNDCEIFVAETGMDYAGELLETGNFIKPHIAMITNISESHLEKLGSLENIKKAKAEIMQTVREGGIVFLNGGNQNILDSKNLTPKTLNAVFYGYGSGCSFTETAVADFIQKPFNEIDFKFIGVHNYENILGASAVAIELGLNKDELLFGLQNTRTPKGRLNVIEGQDGSILIDDTYNSSPVSCISALESVSLYHQKHNPKGRKIAVFGGMLELGSFEDEGHKKVGDFLSKQNFDHVVLVGDLAKKFSDLSDLKDGKTKLHHCENSILAGKYIQSNINSSGEDVILVKGSQGIRMERVVESLMADPSKANLLLVRQDARWK